MSRLRSRARLAAAVTIALTVLACAGDPEPVAEVAGGVATEPAAAAATAAGVMEIALADFSFTAPPTMPAGWTTLRMTNGGKEPHFMVLWQLPDGIHFGDYAEDVTALFGAQHARFAAGEITQEEMMAAIGAGLPEWFMGAGGAGGVGLTSPGRTAEVVVNLAPGEYVMECYVRSADGRFHGEAGMLRPLMVTEPAGAAAEPQADVELTLSNYEITVAAGELTAGAHTVAVTTAEAPEGLLGHDVHLVRLAPEASIDDVVAWMSWVTALQSPAPAPAEFLGGADEVGVGRTSYFSVTLEPGRYAWISEGYAGMGMVREFIVG